MKTHNIREVPLEEIADLPIWPVADIFPMLPDSSGERERGKADAQTISLGELADSISDNGLQEPIVLFIDEEGKTWLLDGRNRRAACKKAKISTVLIEDFYGSAEEADEYVLNLNVDRRDLTPGQRADAAAAYWDLTSKGQGYRSDLDTSVKLHGSPGDTRDALARRFRVNNSYIDKLHRTHETVERHFAQAEALQEKAAELEEVEQEAEAKLIEARAASDAEAIREAAIARNEAALKKVEAREQAAEESQKAAETQRKIDRIRKGESVNSVFGEQKREAIADDPVGKARTQVNGAVANLKKAISDLATLNGKGADDYNFIGTKIEGLIAHFNQAFEED